MPETIPDACYDHGEEGPMRSWARRISQAIAGLCVGYFALWACAPPAAMPPPVPHAAGANEVGGAVSGGASMFSGLPCDQPGQDPCVEPFVDGMAWYLHAPSERLTLGLTAFGGMSSLAGGGLYARYRFNQAPRFFVGLEASTGWFWATLGLPLSVGVTDRLWLYTRPAAGLDFYGPFHVPAGATWALDDAWSLNAEVGSRFPGGSSEYTDYDGPIFYGALGASYRF